MLHVRQSETSEESSLDEPLPQAVERQTPFAHSSRIGEQPVRLSAFFYILRPICADRGRVNSSDL